MIELRGVSKTIRGKEILRDVSFQVAPGEVLGLRGVNGSGKTMLLRIIAGLVHASKGDVVVNGETQCQMARFPSDVGCLIETPAFLPHLSGFENLKLLASIRNVIDEGEVALWLETVGLDPQDRRSFKKYSLGMRQRLGIASALMEAPQVVLLDEPTNALDPDGVRMVAEQILKCKARGAAVVVASHDRETLEETCDTVIQLAEGHIVAPASSEGVAGDRYQDEEGEGHES